ncbi:MAG: (Fe-S)-binding protein [Gaiellaceae bacterium]
MRIALFVTCIGDTVFPEAGRATGEVLERLGHEVVFPAEQTCCGQMHVNSGYRADALSLARRFVDVFDEFDVVVSPSSSCVGNVREAYPRLAREAGDTGLEQAVRDLAPRVLELSELLVKRLGVEDVGAVFPHRVTYHPTCHSLRVTDVGEAPLTLLRHVRGLELVPLARANECCGFGGTFAVKNADTSSAMLSDKCDELAASGAEVCTAVDASCLLQIGGGLGRRGSQLKVMHLAEILASRS